VLSYSGSAVFMGGVVIVAVGVAVYKNDLLP